MKKKPTQAVSFEETILTALRDVDAQIERELKRAPSEPELRGVDNEEIYKKRVEFLAAILLRSMEDEHLRLHSVIVFAQAFMKAFAMEIKDAGAQGLEEVLLDYARSAAGSIGKDAHKITQLLRRSSDTTELS